MAVAAGPNAGLVITAEQKAGMNVPLLQQLGSGNPGLPQVGSLMYQDLASRGLIPGVTARSTATVPVQNPVRQATQTQGSVPPTYSRSYAPRTIPLSVQAIT